jgi:predicted restriction endonuclease
MIQNSDTPANPNTPADLKAKLSSAIATGITEQTGLVVESVDCPDRPLIAGDVFDCTAYGQKSSTMTIQVEQQDDQGNINWEIVGSTRIMDLDVMEQQIVEQLTEQAGISGVVECGDDRYRVAGEGDTFECTGTDDNGNEGIIKVTVQDNEGQLSLGN